MNNFQRMALRATAPNVSALIDAVEQQRAGSNPARKAQYDSLLSTLENSGMADKVDRLEEMLKTDAGFRGNLYKLALHNPAALERIAPQALQNPGNMKELVANAARPPRPASEAPATEARATPQAPRRATAPKVESQARERTAPAEVAAAPAANAATQQEAPPPVVTQTEQEQLLAGKIQKLQSIDGFQELRQRVEGNPRLKDMFDSMMNGGGDDPAASERTLDGILAQAEQNPKIFRDLIKTIDEKPGVVSSIAETMANDPKNGMMMIGMYSQFQQGLGKSLDGLFGPGVLDGLIQGLIGMIGQFFGKSGGLMSMGNNGGDLLRQFGSIVGNTPPVTTIDADSGVASDPARPGTQTPAQLAMQREAEMRRTGQTQQPGMNAPAPSGAG